MTQLMADGTFNCPQLLSPKHTTELSARSAHECCSPSARCTNGPGGGCALAPSEAGQHAIVESESRIAHACLNPTATKAIGESGGVPCRRSGSHTTLLLSS